MKKIINQKLNVKKLPIIIYDNNHNITYYEKPDGSWSKWEYNNNGNQIHYETSSGYWENWEYDYKGNQIYYENSNGSIEDNRPKNVIISMDDIASNMENITYVLSHYGVVCSVIIAKDNDELKTKLKQAIKKEVSPDENSEVCVEYENNIDWGESIVLKTDYVDDGDLIYDNDFCLMKIISY